MFEQFQDIDLFPVSFFDLLSNLFVALLCGIIIALVYRFIYRGSSYSPTFVNSLVVLTLITAVVILVIGNNLARAFGLVGAMSIIRFRTAVRDVQDIVFIFLALTVGMAAGVGLHIVALFGTLFICFVIVILVTFNFGSPRKREYLIQITYLSSQDNDNLVQSTLKKHCKVFNLVNLKNLGEENVEAFYRVKYKNKEKSGDLIRELRQFEQVLQVNMFFDEDDSDVT